MTPAPTSIMVATDFSPPSDEALEYGRMLAEHFGASLHLVHVSDDPAVAAARLTSMVTPTWAMPVTTEVVGGAPARVIVQVARDRGVSLIVMGTHGYGPVAHLILGSVAERVVRTAPCPVLTVRAFGQPATIPTRTALAFAI